MGRFTDGSFLYQGSKTVYPDLVSVPCSLFLSLCVTHAEMGQTTGGRWPFGQLACPLTGSEG